MKEVLRLQGAPDVGDVRLPMSQLTDKGRECAKAAYEMINAAKRDLL